MDITPSPVNEEAPVIATSVSCTYCSKENAGTDNFCLTCGFPLKGSEEEQSAFLGNIEARKIDLEEAEKHIQSVRTYLYILAGFTTVVSIFAYVGSKDTALLIVNVVVSSIYASLGYWSKQKPFAAILSAAILYGTINLLNVFVEPMSIFSGILFKVLIIGMLIKGIRTSLEAEKLRKKIYVND